MEHKQESSAPTLPTDRRAMLAGIGGLAAGALLAGKASAGPLTPPTGPIVSTPGPEPRTAINSTNTPGNSIAAFRINQPGSYYLESNIFETSGRNGLIIDVDHVTVDLNGFSIIGSGGARSGILIRSTRGHIAIRNGFIRSWPRHGIEMIGSLSAANLIVERLVIAESGLVGIWGKTRTFIRNCMVEECASDGILVESDCHISDCVLLSNQGRGIVCQDTTLITRCTIRQHGDIGIFAGSACIIDGCSVRASSGTGISVFSNCRVENNALQDNQTGITAIEANLIVGNIITRYIAADGSPGMLVTNRNRVQGNNIDDTTPA